MSLSPKRLLISWIFLFMSLAASMVVLGGYVRLTRSGLSIVEWNPVSGVIPPLNLSDWEQEFTKYKSSPEFIKINFAITLEQFKEIFFLEWIHRFIARLVGLIFAVPFFIFLFNRTIPVKEVKPYIFMGLLFLAQAVMGWLMVSSGLVDRPSVSHYALTAHLLLAFVLIGLAFWTALDLLYTPATKSSRFSSSSKLFVLILGILLIEVMYGALTAGLKAGHVSNTWPLMLGKFVPDGLLSQVQSPLLNFLESPLTVMFVHRWLAFLVLAAVTRFYWINRRRRFSIELRFGLGLAVGLTILQIFLGVMVVIYNVNLALALIHQANAICLFVVLLFNLYRLRAVDSGAPYFK